MRGACRIVVAGSINVDVTAFVDEFPAVGQTIAASHSMTSMGGKGLNQAVAAAKAGASVTMIGAVGNDRYGQEAIDYLVANEIDVRRVQRVPNVATGTANILVDKNGDNMIAVAAGANARVSDESIAEASECISTSDALITQLEIPLAAVAAALRLANRHKVLTVLNPAPMRADAAPLLQHIDILTPNATEGALLLGQKASESADPDTIARQLLSQGAGSVALTLGSQGCYVRNASMAGAIPALAATVADPTGAGDVFNAVLTVALVAGYKIDEAARFAVAAGAFAVANPSAQGSAPTWSQIEALLARPAANVE